MTQLILRLLIITWLPWNITAQAETAQPAQPAPPSGIYPVLQQHNVLENYLLDEVDELAGTVIQAAGKWPSYRINSAYAEGLINIYLVDSTRLTETNILADFGIELTQSSIQGNALAHEATRTLFLDTVLLKSLITAAHLIAYSNYETIAAVGLLKARGIDAFRNIWNPQINPALKTAEYTEQWVLMASGALAFILAHEIGHIALGEQSVNKRRTPLRFKSREDKDKHWTCTELIDERYRQQQLIEKEADDFAVAVLGKIFFPPDVFEKPLLRYELGAHWYIIYSMGEQMIEALHATESKNIHAALRIQLGDEIYNELKAKRVNTRQGSIKVFFPKTHPANIRRASHSLKQLALSPYSLDYGQESGSNQDIAMFELFIGMECRNLKERYDLQ